MVVQNLELKAHSKGFTDQAFDAAKMVATMYAPVYGLYRALTDREYVDHFLSGNGTSNDDSVLGTSSLIIGGHFIAQVLDATVIGGILGSYFS